MVQQTREGQRCGRHGAEPLPGRPHETLSWAGGDTPSANGRPTGSPSHPRLWICILALVGLSAPAVLWHIGLREVGSSIEERIGITAREMWRRGEWILPTLNGEPRLQKPPLAYWLPETSASIAGTFDDFTLRVPFALLALGSVLFTFGLGSIVWNRTVGLLAGVVLLGSPLFLKSAHMASTDGALLFCVTGAWFFHILGRAPHGSPRAAPWARLAFFIFLGLGMLAKGPVVLALTVLPVIVEAVIARSREPLRALWSPSGILLFLALSAGWPAWVLLRLEDPHVAESWFLESFGKVLPGDLTGVDTEYARHPGPWFYYLTRLGAAFGAWLLAVPFVAGRRLRSPPRGGLHQAILLWFILVFVFFSLVSEKKTFYILPLLPAGALLVAKTVLAGYARWHPVLRRTAGIAAVLALSACAVFLAVTSVPQLLEAVLRIPGLSRLESFIREQAPTLYLMCLTLGVGCLLLWRIDARARPVRPILVLGATTTVLFILSIGIRDAFVPEYKKIRTATMAAGRIAPDPLYCLSSGVRSLPGGVLYYLDRRVRFLGEDPAVLERLPRGAGLLITRKRLEELSQGAEARPEEGRALTPSKAALAVPLPGYGMVRILNSEAPDKEDTLILFEKQPGTSL